MLFPDFLYQLRPYEDRRQTVQIWLRRRSAGVLATVNLLRLTDIEPDAILVLSNITALATPGAGQNINQINLYAEPPEQTATTRIAIAQDGTAEAAGVIKALNWTGEFILPPGWNLLAEGVFNAGVNSNAVNIFAHGILIPRGSLSWTSGTETG